MSFCYDCFKPSGNELEEVKQKAKEYAITNQVTVAIYKEGGQYYFSGAAEAIAGGLVIVSFVSQHQ
jgi:hypothetical protein